ncbi:MAG TPA: tetratricopeptide repeat protein [Rhodanobacter sp.]|nr:tetratricopeptide repeat protein [Rhodanobacter sp.]
MKIVFIVVAALMVALALAVLLVPLVRQGRRSGRSRGVFVLSLAIALVLPLGAGMLYLLIGTPAALNGVSAQARASISLPQAIAELRQHLAQQPDDQQAWMLLAQTSAMLHKPTEARDAYEHVLQLDANNAEAMVGWAESDSMQRDDHMIEGRARELLQRAAQLHPDNQRALWLLGISDFQRGDYRGAAATWRLLQPQLEPGSNVATSVAQQIAVADARAAGAPANASSTAASSTAPAQTPQGVSLQVDVTLAARLKDKLAKGDVLYVYARAPDGPPMPLAVARIDPARFPATVTLTDAMAMTPALKLSGAAQVFVGARISHGGQPTAQAGDLEGDAGVVTVKRKTPVKITIDKVH